MFARYKSSDLGLRAQLRLVQARELFRKRNYGHALRLFQDSVRVVLPERSRHELAQLYVRHRTSMISAQLMRSHLDRLSPVELSDFVDRHVKVDGQEVLDAVAADSGPVIFVTPHYGSFTLGCLKLIRTVGPRKTINAFYNPPERYRSSMGFEELFKRLGYGFNALFNDKTAVLRALRVLKRNEALTMMPDVFEAAGHMLYVPFFGRLMPAMAGTALFALKSKAKVVIGYSCPGPGLQTTLKLHHPLKILQSGDLEADIASLTAAIFRNMEAQICSAPEHWNYLRSIGDLLSNQLALGRGRADDWSKSLQGLTPLVQAQWPTLAQSLGEVMAMQSAATNAPGALHRLGLASPATC